MVLLFYISLFREKFLKQKQPQKFMYYDKYSSLIIKEFRKDQNLDENFKDIPTFREFVEYLTNFPAEEFNEHWIPFHISCTPCHINYSSILHLETIDRDFRYLNNITGLKLKLKHNRRSEPLIEDYQNLAPNDEPKIKQELIERYYFQKISTKTLNKLYTVYTIDFEMFGYSISPFDTYVSD